MTAEIDKTALVAAARAAVTKAFLTKEGGVRYGAAVLTATGNIYSSGQYSSFSHSTNVHAEQAALVAATIAGEPDVLALAVASTGRDAVTRPCGICRQVMLEHAARTGRDFTVLMASVGSWEESTVSALLPHAWESTVQKAEHTRPESPRKSPGGGIPTEQGQEVQAGDHVRLKAGIVALVWDSLPWRGFMLVKLKYRLTGAGEWVKFPHAFSQPCEYERELIRLNNLCSAPCGANVACVRPGEIEEIYPTLTATDLPSIFITCLQQAGVEQSAVRISGSRSTRMCEPDSDFDLVVRADPVHAAALRSHLTAALLEGKLIIPQSSGTWRVLAALYPGGRAGILANGAFAETFEEAGRIIALMILPIEPTTEVHGDTARFMGLATFSGQVQESSRSCFKRSGFTIACPDAGLIEVTSYHKAANLVREGDHVALRGWLVEDQHRKILLQFHPHRENIVWFPPTKNIL